MFCILSKDFVDTENRCAITSNIAITANEQTNKTKHKKQVLKSVKSQPFSIVFRDPDEFFSQLSAPLNATVPSSSTTVVPARLAKGGAEQVLYVGRDLPAAVAQLQVLLAAA